MLRNNADARRCSYFKLGPPVGSEDEAIALFSARLAVKTGQGFQNTKWPAVLYSPQISQIEIIQLNQTIICR